MWAAHNGHVEATVELAKHELSLQTPSGETALMKAVLKNNVECAQVLMGETCKQTADGITATMLAAMHGNNECVQMLKQKEMKIVSASKQTALMRAAVANNVEGIRMLTDEAGM